jgi:hypothetical protein
MLEDIQKSMDRPTGRRCEILGQKNCCNRCCNVYDKINNIGIY